MLLIDLRIANIDLIVPMAETAHSVWEKAIQSSSEQRMCSRRNTLDVSQSHRLIAAELPTFISRQVSEARRYYFELNPESASAMTIVLGGWMR